MAFYSLDALVQKVIMRLRMVAGAGTQLYAEDAIADMLQETYEMVRTVRWWDHLMSWQVRQLDGTTGQVTAPFIGASERFRDVQHIFVSTQNSALPILSSDVNPYRLSGTYPRYVEPLNVGDDATGANLFRIWPLASIAGNDAPLRVRMRNDPASLFTTPTIVVPFDATCLINGAAFKYAADDGTNAASVTSLQATFEARLTQLQRQHDSAKVILDPRYYSPNGLEQWQEEPF